ncbi:MAG: bifunctional phosphoglucose/phosphomannose isomerase [Dehalococcoidia bacterium]|nr:bifunctional phosphoglucose/phosphomannose isomerase [Dehalococcoidia bacterium]
MPADLDRPETYLKLDPNDLLSRIRELPQQCRLAWEKGLRFPLPAEYRDIDKVVVLGMGGSAIGGDLLRCLALEQSPTPIFVQRDYTLPPFVNARTLVIASSYSGNTEETLSAFDQALAGPAMKLALTTGGKLKARADKKGVPVLGIAYKSEPRSALAHSFMPLLAICQRLSVLPDHSAAVDEMLREMDALSRELDRGVPLARNPAKQLATRLHGRMGLVYSAGFLADAARRWKTQLNENSKAWAFFELLPELNHNSVVGYEFPPQVGKSAFAVFLRSPLLHPRVLKRYDLTADILRQAGVDSETVQARGQSRLSQMMGLVLFGDFVSYYLALLNGVDPAPVKVIDRLKKRLAEG